MNSKISDFFAVVEPTTKLNLPLALLISKYLDFLILIELIILNYVGGWQKRATTAGEKLELPTKAKSLALPGRIASGVALIQK